MAKARASVGMELVNGDELTKALNKIETLVRIKVTDKAVRAGARPVRSKMRSLTPDSRTTGSVAKQSKSTQSKWKSSAKLKNVIRAVYRKTPTGMMSFVGPSYTDGGGHGNFFASNHKRKVLWGRDSRSGRVVNRFVKNAADQSRNEAKTAMLSTIKKEIDEAARTAGRG